MKGNRAVLTAVVVVVVLIAGWWLFRRGGSGEAVDLLQRFDTAQRRPSPDVFQVVDANLNGETKKAIFTSQAGRIIWKVRVPDDAWLRVAVGTQPESWTKEGDGMLFMVGVSDGRAFEELFTQHVNPYGNETDRRWIPVVVDLSTYAGEDVELIFNTYHSAKGQGDDHRNDAALWGAPEIFVR